MVPEQRRKLHDLLEEVLGSDEVYFQPPTGAQMTYPAIAYDLDDVDVEFADNMGYRSFDRYSITVMDRDPDSDIWRKLILLPMCTFSRRASANQLNMFYLNIYV